MAEKRALVVDDSRSARAFLGRILERHDLLVDSVESAEEAIDYLSRQHPDVIFMDHLMPGMDGLQAVKLIKGDPRTATIPILMYTSQEGELYLSQARALGAVGVLPKQTRPGDVTKTLIQLRLVADRREQELPPRTDEHARPIIPMPSAAPVNTETGIESLTPELRRLVAALLNDQSSEMRRFVVEHLESHADRIVGDVRLMLKDETPVVPEVAAVPPPAGRSYWLPLLGALAAVFAAASIWFWLQLMNSQQQSNVRLAGARAELDALQARLQLAARQLSEARAGTTLEAVRELRDSYVELVPFGEAPLSGVRVDHLQSRLEQLLADGFRGRVQILTFAGRFCTSSGDAVPLPGSDVPYAQCALAALTPGNVAATRESVAFANMLAALRKRAGEALEITQAVGNADDLATAYPAVSDKLTAAEWNAAATLNNRVELHWSATR
jgi:CheY-like chemotaxis protein